MDRNDNNLPLRPIFRRIFRQLRFCDRLSAVNGSAGMFCSRSDPLCSDTFDFRLRMNRKELELTLFTQSNHHAAVGIGQPTLGFQHFSKEPVGSDLQGQERTQLFRER